MVASTSNTKFPPVHAPTFSNTPTKTDDRSVKRYFGKNCSQDEIKSDIFFKNVQQPVKKFLNQFKNISLDQLHSESFKKNVQQFVDNLSELRGMVGEKVHKIKNAVNIFVQKVIKYVFDSISSLSTKTKGTLEKLAAKLISLVNKLSEKLEGLVSYPIVKAVIAIALATVIAVLASVLIGGVGVIISNPITLSAMLFVAFIGFVMYYTLFDNLDATTTMPNSKNDNIKNAVTLLENTVNSF